MVFGAQLVGELGGFFDLRLGGGAFGDGGAFGEHGSHHDVVGAEHGGAVFAHQIHGAAFEAFFGVHMDVAAIDLNLSAEGFETFEMAVPRATPDDAAAGE